MHVGDCADKHSYGKNNILVSLSITQQQMEITFMADQQPQCIDVTKRLPSNFIPSDTKEDRLAVVDTKHCDKKEHDEIKFKTENLTSKIRNADLLVARINAWGDWIDADDVIDDHAYGPNDAHFKWHNDFDLNSISMEVIDSISNAMINIETDTYRIHGSKKSLKRKIFNENGANNGMKDSKIMRRCDIFDVKRYNYNFRRLFLKHESPLQRYLPWKRCSDK